jgi:hypothetical protein
MEQTPPRLTVVLGIDPGRNTGLYSVSIPTVSHALTLDEFQQHARWLGNAVISLSTRESATLPFRWREMQKRIEDAVFSVNPNLTVLEFPKDGMTKWSGGTGRGTDFGMGMFFGFAALAVTHHSISFGAQPIALMPVTSSKAKNREGWMPRVRGKRNNLHTQDKDTTLRQCREIAHWIGINSDQRSEDVDALSEHELMALGVLTYYVTHKAPSEWGE